MTAVGVSPSAAVVASRYRFDDVVVDLGARTLVRSGEVRTVEPKAFGVLAVLLQHAGELVTRDELLDAVWGHRHVTPGVLTRVIAQLRHALDDDAQQPRYIQTRHALGYCFIGDLQPESAADGGERVPPAQGPPQPVVEDAQTPPDVRVPRRRAAWIAAAVAAAMLVVAFLLPRLPPREPSPPPVAGTSIAVHPFASVGGDPADRYFAEGLAAEMHSALAGVHGLQVAAWASDAASTDARSLGRRAGVASVLDARVARTGERVHIDARLVDSASGASLWQRSYDRPIGEIFALQGAIAADVAVAVLGTLPDAGEGLRRRLATTRNVAAFDAYLRGIHELLAPRSDRPRALGYFREALQKDPGFARAQAAICRTESWRFESQRNPAAFDAARLACRTAENMDPGIGEVQLALGDLHRVKGEHEKAGDYYRRIVDYPDQRAHALVGLAKLDVAAGRFEDALARFGEALSASPSDPRIHAELGYQQYVAGDVDAAIASLANATRLGPDDADAWGLYGALLLTAGRTDAAEKALERGVALDPDDRMLANLGTVKFQRGDYAAAAALYRRAAALSPDMYINYGNLGDALLAGAGTAGEATPAFRRAASLAQRYVDFNGGDAITLAALGWFRANLGEHERARQLLRRAEAADAHDADVAFYNAQTLLALGDVEGARRRIDIARSAGIAEERLVANPLFVRAGIVAR